VAVSLFLTVLVLVAALMHASWNALVKSSQDPLVELATLNLAAGAAGLLLAPVVGFPGSESVPYLAGNVICHSAYYTFLLFSYSSGGLSLVYPIARGSAPLLVAAATAAFLGEPLGFERSLGVTLIALSIASLAFSGGKHALRLRPVAFSLATGVTIAAYTLIDGTGARTARSPFSYIAWIFILNGVLLLPVVRMRRRGTALERIKMQWKTGTLSGLLSLGAYGIAVWAMTRAPIALVAAVRETSVVAAALIGALFLGEPFGRYRVTASVGVALGIAVLRIAG
jgi:drug/metabolite transporter (DMT)-like permease